MIFVDKIAALARIEITEEERERLEKDLSSILAFVRQLDSVDTTDVPPMTSVVETNLRQRADVLSEENPVSRIVEQAPSRHGDYFSVPKVID